MVYFKGKQEFFKVPGEWKGTNIFQGVGGVNFFQWSVLIPQDTLGHPKTAKHALLTCSFGKTM